MQHSKHSNWSNGSVYGGMGREELYEVLKPIGSGSFGQVFLVLHRREKKQYVMKSIELKSTTLEGREAAELEVRLLSAMRHPNIVTYRESFMNAAGHLCIFMEYCEHGDVYSYLQEAKKAGKVPDESRLVEWFIQISLALHALHLKKILHRDLKTQNIFLTGNRPQNVFALKLGDFGIATVLNSTHELAKTQIGTPFYMSPELINNKPYSYKSDIWGLGCVLYEIVNGQRAFDAQGLNGLALKIIKGHYTPITASCSPDTRSLIKSMLNRNPKNRPTLKEILHLSSLRPRIPVAQRNVINAGPQEARPGIEQSLNNQLVTLGLGSLVNCPGAGPRRDRGRVLRRLEKAKARKRREEEQLQRTAALLAQCLGERPPPMPPPQAERDGSTGHGSMRNSDMWHADHTSVEPQDTGTRLSEESPEDIPVRTVSHKMPKEKGSTHRHRSRGHDRKERAPADDPAGGGSGSLPVAKDRRRSPRQSRAPSKEVPPIGDAVASAREHSSAERWRPEQLDGRRGNVHSSPRGQTPTRRRGRARTTDFGPPPPAAFGEPLPPQDVPHKSASQLYNCRSGDAFRPAPPARQPMHSVCLEALNTPERGSSFHSDRERGSWNWTSDDSCSSGSLSEVDEWDAGMGGNSWANEQQRHQRSLQQRIDESRAIIYRQKMTIAMLQYSAAQEEHEAPSAPPRPPESYVGSGDEDQQQPPAMHHPLAGSQLAAHAVPGAPAFVQDFTARLQRRCLEGLGLEKFRAARRTLRDAMENAEVPANVRQRMLPLLGIDKIGFLSLLDQLVHIERRWGAQEAI